MSTVPPTPGYFSDHPTPLASAATRGLVGQVRLVAILNAVEATLELIVAAFCLLTGAVVLVLPAEVQQQGGGNPAALAGIYLTAGSVHLILAALRLIASWRNYHFQNRALGIVSLCAGLISTFAGCCALTSLGVAIFGLIVFFDAAVINAFERRSHGASLDEILSVAPASGKT